MALIGVDIKRVLAYSTISQLGIIVAAIGSGALFTSQFHLLSHAVFKALLFLGAGAVILATGTRDLRQMGGLGRRMPFVRATFIVGALALAGLPFLNGFWSKELLVDAFLTRGPGWAYAAMLAGVALTALYTFRLAWMIFYGTPKTTGRYSSPAVLGPASPGGIALGLLAIGTVSSWLLAGALGRLLDGSLSMEYLHPKTTAQSVRAVVTAPATALALLMAALGLAAWWWRARLAWLADRLRGLRRAVAADYGFEWLNDRIGSLILRAAAALSATQTGQLNWNMVGIAGGLAIVLAILAWGGR
jgi:NADH-quinone oxidoreductase subunit L